MTELGNKLRTLREQRGLNMRQLADELGVTPPAVSHMESGIRLPSFMMLVKLANFFDVSTDELTRLDTKETAETKTAEPA